MMSSYEKGRGCMKKILSCFVVVILLFSFASCDTFPIYEYDENGNLLYNNYAYTTDGCEWDYGDENFRVLRTSDEQIGSYLTWHGFPAPLYRSRLDENINFVFGDGHLFRRTDYVFPDIYSCPLQDMEIGDGNRYEETGYLYILYCKIDASLNGLSINDLVYKDKTYVFHGEPWYLLSAVIKDEPCLLAALYVYSVEGRTYITTQSWYPALKEEPPVYQVKEEYQEYFSFDIQKYEEGDHFRSPGL